MAKKKGEPLIIAVGFTKEELSRAMTHFKHSPFTLDAVIYQKLEGAYRSLCAEEQRRRDILLHPKSCPGCKGQGANFDCAVRH